METCRLSIAAWILYYLCITPSEVCTRGCTGSIFNLIETIIIIKGFDSLRIGPRNYFITTLQSVGYLF